MIDAPIASKQGRGQNVSYWLYLRHQCVVSIVFWMTTQIGKGIYIKTSIQSIEMLGQKHPYSPEIEK